MHVAQLGIAAPCGQTLDSMGATRDPSARFCSSCQERVVDLSKLTRREAEAVLRRGECVSAAYDAAGDVMFRPERRRLPMLRAAAVAAPLWLLGCQPAAKDVSEPSAPITPDRPTMPVQPSAAALPDEPAEACELGASAASSTGEPRPSRTRPAANLPQTRPVAKPHAYPRLAGKPAFRPSRP